ncbi:MAG: tetratricopeptide repeat protein [Bacteroidales bacterium]|nr:tetratricopeptide repeat protein [Bacteroidales bacterium]
MKRHLIISLALLAACSALLAQSTQPCVVTQYNQKSTKTPLPGVTVMASNAGSTVSDNDGRLTLVFRTLKPGDKVNLISAKKAGFELFNTEAVEQWNISRDQTPFSLVLVSTEYFNALKAKLAQTSTNSYQRKYEQAVRELEAQKQAGKLQEEEFNRKYDELDARYQIQLSNLDNYIDQFARIDISEVSAEEQRILEMVEEGRIDEAVEAYDALDLSGRLRQARESKKALVDARARIEEEEARQESAIRALKVRQEREIATLKLAGGKENYDKIGKILKENALADTTDIDAVWTYANFAKDQKDFREAERFYLICRNGWADSLDKLSSVWTNLGYIFYNVYDYDRAKEYWTRAWEYRTKAFARNPDPYRLGLAHLQLNLGLLYRVLHDFEQSEVFYLQALENYAQLFAQDPETYRPDMADVQLDLGALYRVLRNYDKCEAYYLQALDNYNQLFARDPETYRASLTMIQYNLGYFYYSRNDFAKAQQFYLQALEHRKKLVERNPDAYRMDLARVQNDLGMLYRAAGDYPRAEEYYSQALDNITITFSQSPDAYRADLARTLANMGNFYRTVGNYPKAEECYLKAADHFGEMFRQNPEANRMDQSRILNTLGYFYYTIHDYSRAEECYFRSLEHRQLLYERNPGVYGGAVAQSQINLSLLYMATQKYDKALESIDKAIALTPDDADCYDSKGEILLKKGDTKGALKMWKKVLEVNPDYLSENKEGTELYNGLKQKGLIKK